MSVSNQSSPSDLLKPHQHECVKQYIEYDGLFRMWKTYVAAHNAEDGAVALKTEYQYDATSTRITGMKESLSTWDSSWDF